MKPFPIECRHFNGIQHDTCKAGVSYRSLLVGKRSLPCLGGELFLGRPLAECDKRSDMSQEETNAKWSELVELDRKLGEERS